MFGVKPKTSTSAESERANKGNPEPKRKGVYVTIRLPEPPKMPGNFPEVAVVYKVGVSACGSASCYLGNIYRDGPEASPGHSRLGFGCKGSKCSKWTEVEQPICPNKTLGQLGQLIQQRAHPQSLVAINSNFTLKLKDLNNGHK